MGTRLVVHEIFVVSRKVVPSEVLSIYRAGRDWATEIGACEYEYGTSTGIDLEPMALRIGYDVKSQSYTKNLRKPAEVEAAE